jgi:lysophospholipase L1-like esterase
MKLIHIFLVFFITFDMTCQVKFTDSSYIVNQLRYSKDLSFIDTKTNEIEFYDLRVIKPFFEKLKLSQEQKVTILHFGDSHVQYDQAPGIIRQNFQNIFGFSGRGFVFPYAAAGTHAAYDYKTKMIGSWTNSKNINKDIKHPLGVSGVTIKTTDSTAGFQIQFYAPKEELKTLDLLTLFIKTSDSSYQLKYRISETESWTNISISPSFKNKIELKLPQKFNTFIEFQVNKTDSIQNEFEFYGMQLSTTHNKGISYNSVGINGASLLSFLKQDLFEDQVKAVNPDLIILDYGTNDLAGGKFDSTYFITNLTKSIQRIKEVLPSTCIIIPTIQDFTVNGKNIAATAEYAGFLRRFAKKNNVVFYDYFAIAGGKRSMKKWLNNGIAKSDQIHLTQQGYILKGELYGNAILTSYARYLSNPTERVIFDRKPLQPIIKDTIEVNDSISSEINEISKKNVIVNQIPKKTSNVETPKNKVTSANSTTAKKNKFYTVKKGDTLTEIAVKSRTSVSQLKKVNKLKSDKLQIGQKLILP